MALDALRGSLPEYARDLSTNLEVLAGESLLTDQQKWGTFVASAHAMTTPSVLRAIEAEARTAGLSEAAFTAAKTAAAIMGMNNVYYRAIHLMENHEYRHLPSRLRMNVLTHPGVDKVDFELFALAVSAINGCASCLDAHEAALKTRGIPPAAVQAALRIASVVHAVSRVVAGEDASRG